MSRPPSSSPIWKAWLHTLSHTPKKSAAFTQAETGKTNSIGELNEEADRLALQLSGTSGSWVAYSMKNQAEWMTLFLACQSVGAAAMPLDPHLPASSLAATARALGAHFLWQDGTLLRLSSLEGARSKMACIKTTSGSTGQIQPVPCLADHLIADGENILSTMKIRPSDKNLGLVPLGHSYGLGNLVMPLILQGNPLVAAGEFVPSQISSWISKYRITVLPAVPGILRVLAQLPGRKSLRPLRLVLSAGAPLSSDTAQAFCKRYQLKVHNFYGSSETGGICYDRQGNASLAGRSVGKPLDGVTVNLSPSGSIQVSGKAVAVGRTMYTLPDLGAWNKYNELTLSGRAHAVANIGGRKIAPAEIEKFLRSLAGVDDVWVEVIHLKNRDYLIAALESSTDKETILNQLHRELPAWKIPRFLEVSLSLPRTPRGKLDRIALRGLFPK